jgi:hypothetical protein
MSPKKKRTDYPRRRKTMPADVVLQQVVRRLDGTDELKLVPLWRNWERVLGPELAAFARPLGHRRGTLILGAPDPVALQELSFVGPEILGLVNRSLGEIFFDKVSYEVIGGRVPLDMIQQTHDTNADRVVEIPRPARLGALRPDPSTAAGRSYYAYLRAMGVSNDADDKEHSDERRRND